MKNYPNEIKLVILVVLTFSFGILCDSVIHNLSYIHERIVQEEPYDLELEFGDEYETIMAAAERNGCDADNLLILFAIRKSENGPLGFEFGVECQRGTDLNTQAGWAAATIMKNRERYNGSPGYEELFGIKGFIVFLGKRYCPLNSEEWIHNVTYWFDRFKNGS